jgi:hypothetical protein
MEHRLILQDAKTAELNVPAMAAKLDRTDVLLLKEFYLVRSNPPDGTQSHVLRLLVDRLRQRDGLGGQRLGYSAIRQRLENLVELGLLGKIARTNPKVYYPLDDRARQIRRIIVHFAAEVVGLTHGGDPR